MEDVTRLSRCARCGTALPIDSRDELCASCADAVFAAPTVMGAALGASDETRILSAPLSASAGANDVTILAGRTASYPRGPVAPKLAPGQTFGHYRVDRLLGRGGMGDVYEAEHVEHGRRVAIKVLNSALAGEDDRARFFDEGRTAAAITHPHTVYIFGSEEIDGAPVIAMELLSGGTLRDLVQKHGPMAPAQAVDAILQVIAGLDAAGRAGILHRDVKPANCFVDLAGNIKVGDFGLSIATHTRQQQTGMFLGTPQFAPPEQIRGEALDLRADIYAVGGTLFYLLTGQPPFDDRDLTTLVTRVTTEAPRSPREMSANVPAALADIVTACLAKHRDQRPASYAALEDLLRPFSSAAPVPASLRRRSIAGVLDMALFMGLFIPVTMYYMFTGGSLQAQWFRALLQVPFWLMYFSVLEGRWGASIGKRVLGLQVETIEGQRPGVARALGRVAIYQAPAMFSSVPFAIYSARHASEIMAHPLLSFTAGLGYYVLLALLFLPARRRNGFAALQDRLSGTRVVRRRARSATATVDLPADSTGASLALPAPAGPFEVTSSFGLTDAGELRPGFDPQLKRRVWVHVLPPGSAPLSPTLRDLSRVARLRWLSGRRSSAEAWDAYEAFDGRPLMTIPRPQRWGVVRRWLLELAVEIEAGVKDGSLGMLTLDRVWITRDGHARLLDFRAPGAVSDAGSGAPADLASAQRWLAKIAACGLTGSSSPASTLPSTLPLSGRATVDALASASFASPADVITHIAAVQTTPDVVEPWRRVASIVLPLAGPAIGLGFGLLVAVGVTTLAQTQPDVDAVRDALKQLKEVSARTGPEAEDERRNLETYIAGTFRATLSSPQIWSAPLTGAQVAPYHALADAVLAAHPAVSDEELAAAKASLGTFMDEQKKDFEGQQRRSLIASQIVGVAMTLIGLGAVAFFGLIFAPVFRSGLLLRLFGLATVDAHGRPASRGRAFVRALITWLPAIALIALVFIFPVSFKDSAFMASHKSWFAILAIPLLVFFAGAIVAIARPARGWQDQLAGTFIVPR